MKKIMIITLALAMSLSITACNQKNNENKEVNSSTTVGGVQIANPFVECETLEAAAEIAGFTIEASAPDWVEKTVIRAIKDNMIEIIYKNSDKEIRVRKGSSEEDISGLYENFEVEENISIDDKTITIKGSENAVKVAIWEKDKYSFAVVAKDGIEREEMENIIQGILN